MRKIKKWLRRILWRLGHRFSCPSRFDEEPAFRCPDCGKKYWCYFDGNDCSCGMIHLCSRCAKKHKELGHA